MAAAALLLTPGQSVSSPPHVSISKSTTDRRSPLWYSYSQKCDMYLMSLFTLMPYTHVDADLLPPKKSRSEDRLLRLHDRDPYHALLCSVVIYLKNAAASESLSILSGSSFFELLSLSEKQTFADGPVHCFFLIAVEAVRAA